MTTPRPPKAMVALLNSSEDVIEQLQQALDEGGFRTAAAHIADVQMGVLDLIAWMSETGADVILVDLPRPDARALNFLRLLPHVDMLRECGWVLTTTHKDALETMLAATNRHDVVVVGQPDVAGQVAEERAAPWPRAEADDTMMSEPHATTLMAVRVLVVDDNAVLRALLTTLLEDYGATVTSAGSAAAALRILPMERPDVLLTDLSMPEADGFSLIRQVRALPREHGGRTPAALVTGLAAAQHRAEVLRAGFQFCLAKPVNEAELVAAVAILATKE